jgi:predicted transcriptional regulator
VALEEVQEVKPWTIDGIWRAKGLTATDKLFALAVYEGRARDWEQMRTLVPISTATRTRVLKRLVDKGIIEVVQKSRSNAHEYLWV